MNSIEKARSISIWIFIVPFVAVNACLILVTQFHGVFESEADRLYNTIPYIDGGASISRTARPYPSWLIFKPAMFLTSYLLIKYWLFNRDIIKYFENDHKNLKRIVFFGIASAVALTVHSIFLGIKFDNDLYKLFRRVVMLSFIIYLVLHYVMEGLCDNIIEFNSYCIFRIILTGIFVITAFVFHYYLLTLSNCLSVTTYVFYIF